MEDIELSAFSNETHLVEFDKYGSRRIKVSFGQVTFGSDKTSQTRSWILQNVESASVPISDSADSGAGERQETSEWL